MMSGYKDDMRAMVDGRMMIMRGITSKSLCVEKVVTYGLPMDIRLLRLEFFCCDEPREPRRTIL